MSGKIAKRYPVELRERAVRMVAEIRDAHESEWAAIGQVATLLGVTSAETVRQPGVFTAVGFDHVWGARLDVGRCS